MIKLEINDKKYRIPESFDELTLEEYCRIFWKMDSVMSDDEVEQFKKGVEAESTIISRLMGEDDDFCLGLPINVYSQIVQRLRYLYDVDFLRKSSKARIVIDGKRYSVPPFNEMPLRQYIDADVILKDKENPMQYIELLAVLLTAKDKDGKWIPYNGEYQDMMGKLRKMPCSEALGIVYHFFKKGHSLKRISQLSMKVEESR